MCPRNKVFHGLQSKHNITLFHTTSNKGIKSKARLPKAKLELSSSYSCKYMLFYRLMHPYKIMRAYSNNWHWKQWPLTRTQQQHDSEVYIYISINQDVSLVQLHCTWGVTNRDLYITLHISIFVHIYKHQYNSKGQVYNANNTYIHMILAPSL